MKKTVGLLLAVALVAGVAGASFAAKAAASSFKPFAVYVENGSKDNHFAPSGWMGIFWQQPANNWGEKKGGFNLTGAKKLTFWARGAQGGEKIAEFKMGGITGEYSDTDSVTMGPIELTKEWKQYTLDLSGKDLSNIIGGFCFAMSKEDNPNGCIFYIDDIIYE